MKKNKVKEVNIWCQGVNYFKARILLFCFPYFKVWYDKDNRGNSMDDQIVINAVIANLSSEERQRHVKVNFPVFFFLLYVICLI
jgi:hypothetical protein